MIREPTQQAAILVERKAGAPTTRLPGMDDDLIAHAAGEVVARLGVAEVAAVLEAFESTRQIVRDVDRQLLGSSRARLGRELHASEKRQLREEFLESCRSHLAG